MRVFLVRVYWALRFVFVCVALLFAAGAFVYVTVPWSTPEADPQPVKNTAESDSIRLDGDERLIVPTAVARRIGLRTAKVTTPTRPIRLPAFQGCLALDNTGLARVRSRFAGEVVNVAKTSDLPSVPSYLKNPRPLRAGDRVKKGDLLAVVWSKDLGEKKSELVEAVSKLRADQLALTRARELYQTGAGSERLVRETERAFESDRVIVDRAERTLRSWGLTTDEVAMVRKEAAKLTQPDARRTDPGQWARVEVRSPRDGVVLERNLATGDIVDTATDLFKIGDLSYLTVWAHLYEEDLPLLQSLPKPIRWTIQLPSRPGTIFNGTLEQIGEIIDPNQHTALVSGRIENPDGMLKIGQFVTVTVAVPPPSGEIELPSDAVVEDGRQSIVLVQEDEQGERYIRREVRVIRRLRDVVYVRDEPTGLRTGQQVVTAGALLLREAMESLPRSEKPNLARRNATATEQQSVR